MPKIKLSEIDITVNPSEEHPWNGDFIPTPVSALSEDAVTTLRVLDFTMREARKEHGTINYYRLKILSPEVGIDICAAWADNRMLNCEGLRCKSCVIRLFIEENGIKFKKPSRIRR